MNLSPIRFARPEDGISVAYRFEGDADSAYTIACAAHIPQHLETSRALPRLRSEMEHATSLGVRFLVYDQRGSGLSTREAPEYSPDSRLADLECVIDAAGVDRIVLFAAATAGPTAIRYAHKHPERVDAIIFDDSFAYGGDIRGLEALFALIEVNWPVAARALMDITFPLAASTGFDIVEPLARNLRESADPAAAAAIMRAGFFDDARELLSELRVPALIRHPAGARNIPETLARQLASQIERSEYRTVQWANAMPLTDAEQIESWRMVREFLDREVGTEQPQTSPRPGTFQTILFTDLEASTALTQSLGDAGAQELLRQHDAAVRTALNEHGGTEVKHTGDGIMAAFGSAVGAVEAALRVQHDLHDSQIRVRIGMNAGEPIAENDDYFGSAVQLAARICDRAEPGQVLVPQVVRDLCLGKGFQFDDQGESTFKGFVEPVRVFTVSAVGRGESSEETAAI